MSEYRYTNQDRVEQLHQLVKALSDLIDYLNKKIMFIEKVAVYETAFAEANKLLKQGFTQNELSMLGRSVPDLFNRHKEWYPPLEDESNYLSTPAKWFLELEIYLQPVIQTASILNVVGYY